MYEIKKITQKFISRKNSKNEIKKNKIDRRVNEFEQFEKNDEFYKKIWIY